MKKVYYNQALNEALMEEMKRDERVFLLGEDIGIYGGVYRVTHKLIDMFGEERVKDTPISEAAMTGIAIGVAIAGMRPIVEIMYMDFIGLVLDQLINQASCLHYISGGQVCVPMVLRTQGGAAPLGGARHSKSLEVWLTHIPGLKVIMPSNPYDAKGLLKAAIRDNNPVVFIEHKLLYEVRGEIPDEEYIIPIGKADIKKKGKDLTIIATSRMVQEALYAAKDLEKEGINVEVVDPRTLIPLDKETILNSIKKTNRAIVVHEAWKTCGFGAEIVSIIMEEAFDYLDAPVKRVGGIDVPIPYSTALASQLIPNKDSIISAVKEVLSY